VPESHGVIEVDNKAFAGAESVAWVVPPDPEFLLRPTVAQDDRRTAGALAFSFSLAIKSDESPRMHDRLICAVPNVPLAGSASTL